MACCYLNKGLIVVVICIFTLPVSPPAQLLSYAKSNLNYTRPPTFYDELLTTKKGGTLQNSMSSDPKVLNPVISADSASNAIEGFLWLPLFTIDPQNLNYLPALATDYSISKDRKSYTFTLNSKARWQDGTPVTSEDIKFTFDTIMNPKTNAAPQRSYYQGLKITVIDSTKFTFTVEEPRFDTLYVLCLFTAIQKKQFANTKDFNTDKGIMKPIGNGPYMLETFERGDHITLKRNKEWWGYTLPHFKNQFNLDEVVVRIIGDNNLSYEKFIKQNIDVLNFTAEQWHNKVTGIDRNKFGFDAQSGKKIWALKEKNKFPKPYSYIGWNLRRAIFSDVQTRTAMSHLINYKKILENVFFDLQQQSTSPFGSLTLNSSQALREPGRMITFDKKKAARLLKESGWKNEGGDTLVKEINGKKVEFRFSLDIVAQSGAAVKMAQILKEDFKSSGIDIQINSMEWNAFLDKVTERHDFDAVILAWTSTFFPNPKQIWDTSSQSLGGSNYIGYSNPKVDALIAKANMEFDPKQRNLLMQEINELIYADQPYTFLAEPKYILQGINSRIQSQKWITEYGSSASTDLFYLP